MRKSRVFIALLHHPMYNKRMEVITTSITNLDLHDIARTARTYEVDGFYVVHPASGQRRLVEDIITYWQQGFGGSYNPDRREAFQTLRLASSLDEVLQSLKKESGQDIITVATDARIYPNTVSYAYLKKEIEETDRTFLLLFGTGWGMQDELMMKSHYILEPVEAGRGYNHLSVRSAVAIILDRLLGEFWFAR
ncbi:MAG TPA: RNA methyltransferase [Syntrophomonadaceae bacterium]|nr:RNA methyltransferase [Syntrophomonadaceae bacterium]